MKLKCVKISRVDVAKGGSKGGSLIFVQDFKGGPLIIKPYSRSGPRKNIQLKI
jgi:hypothetical protein